MINCLAVGIGGFIGSIFRYLVGLIPIKNNAGFPINTLIINVVGAFLIGLIVTAFSKNADANGTWLLLLKVGLCGGFTTFSTFSLESMNLIKSGSAGAAALYILLSVALSIAAIFFGIAVAK